MSSVRFLFLLLLAGCSLPSSIDPSSIPSGPSRYLQTSGSLGRSFQPWWKSLSDSRLDRDVQEALAGNLAQRQLATRIEQASASLRREGSALFPQVDLAGDLNYDSFDPGNSVKSASFGSLLSWEVDVWGRIRSGVRARELERDAAFQDWLGGRLFLSAAVAETRMIILEQRARLAVLNSQIDTNGTLLELVQARVAQGLASRVDLLQQERQLDATRALVPPTEADIAAAQYALDVLAGKAPGTSSKDTRASLPDLPALPSAGVPSDLLKNRPDLLAQWNRILALDSEVAQALADRLPRLVIGASIDRGSFDGITSTITGLIAEATLPVIDGGARRAEVELRRSLLEDALLGYSKTYLEAIRDVETALVRERKQSERIQLTRRQLHTARKTLEETRIRYSQGLSDYLPVIDALTSVQLLELTMVALQREALVLRIGLHRALGGPMPHTNPPDFSS
ncbi:efflux transporter outer membrane subunit [Haloferula chungangensis]|uniref:Efflux transporter outer membrane subunit n=1 Tax=Haloferula chungangensis TaxID=1048331 RepID=A0ABW2L4R0_9BACT